MGAEKLEDVVADVIADVIQLNRETFSGKALLARQEQEIMETKAVIRKFKGAIKVGQRWESNDVTYANAKHFDVDSGGNGLVFDMYVEVKPANQEPVRVYAAKTYRLTPKHVGEFVHNNQKMLIKQMARIFKIQ